MTKGRDKHLHCTRWLFVGGDAHIAPLSTTEFAVAFHKNSFFCGRTEASAPTSPLMLKVYFLEFM